MSHIVIMTVNIIICCGYNGYIGWHYKGLWNCSFWFSWSFPRPRKSTNLCSPHLKSSTLRNPTPEILEKGFRLTEFKLTSFVFLMCTISRKDEVWKMAPCRQIRQSKIKFHPCPDFVADDLNQHKFRSSGLWLTGERPSNGTPKVRIPQSSCGLLSIIDDLVGWFLPAITTCWLHLPTIEPTMTFVNIQSNVSTTHFETVTLALA